MGLLMAVYGSPKIISKFLYVELVATDLIEIQSGYNKEMAAGIIYEQIISAYHLKERLIKWVGVVLVASTLL